MDFSGSSDSSLFIWSAVDVEGLERQYRLGWEEKVTNKGGVNEISGGSTVHKGGCYNGSCSIS